MDKLNKGLKALVPVVVYFVVLMLFSIKTIYYFNENSIWWVYVICFSVLFTYFVYLCHSSKLSGIWLLICFSFVLGYMPFETEVPRIFDLITNKHAILSGLASNIDSYPLGVFVDLFFYPVLMFILLLVVKRTLKP
jgi:hypothetical protein